MITDQRTLYKLFKPWFKLQIIYKLTLRWIDFKNDYKTLYPWYMETIWWVFKQLWDKGLIYKGFRVMPYSTGCCTPLANFEVRMSSSLDTVRKFENFTQLEMDELRV